MVDLFEKGKIRRSKSPSGAPLLFLEQEVILRGVTNNRGLNQITKKNKTFIPGLDEMFYILRKAKYFSKMDLKTGYYQICVTTEDIEKTACNTKYGHFEFLVMHMGLCYAPATFQSLVNQIFKDCIDKFIVACMDDLLIFSKTPEDHIQYLKIVLSRLSEHELYVDRDKCTFFQRK